MSFVFRAFAASLLNRRGFLLQIVPGLALWGAAFSPTPTAAQVSTDSPRMTKGVELIATVKPAVAAIFAPNKDGTGGSTGTGTVIHPAGYVLTANHVVDGGDEGFAVFGLTRETYRVVGRLPEKDLAILKIESPTPRRHVPLGRSHDTMDGEPVVVIGNPGGRGLVFSQGIVSAASIDPSWPTLLSKTYWRAEATRGEEGRFDGRDDFIQFDAASNRGNSGGPLINHAGDLIGVVSQKSYEEQGINWAIPADRVRRYFDYMVQPEEQHGFWLGVEMDPFARGAVVRAVAAGSPAAAAGLAAGDVVTKFNDQPVASASDWLLLLLDGGHKPGATVKVAAVRGDDRREVEIALAEYPVAAAVEKKGKATGLRYDLYRPTGGEVWKRIPDVAGLKPAQTGSVAVLGPDAYVEGEKSNYAVVFRGHMEFPRAGRYRVSLTSDDGSRLFINDRLVVDNDFAHPEAQLSRMVRVGAGLTPVRVEYFESRGGRALGVKVQALDKPDAPVEEAVFYRE
jgi:S1-C subfamily serine protease